jgi:hypothetical protein
MNVVHIYSLVNPCVQLEASRQATRRGALDNPQRSLVDAAAHYRIMIQSAS